MTLDHHLTGKDLDYAAQLLRCTDKSVGLVALECGFADQSYFTKVFKKRTGQTPLAYRRRFPPGAPI